MDIGEEEVRHVMINEQYSGINTSEGASKLLTAYKQQQTINTNKDLVISSSCLNFVKNTIAKYIELINICRHLSFDLFLNLSQACEFYVFVVFHMFAES